MKHTKIYDETGKYLPQRTCVACRTVKDKSTMLKITKEDGVKSGRGAYVCDNISCIEKVIKTRGLNRAFRGEVSKEKYSLLEVRLEKLRGILNG